MPLQTTPTPAPPVCERYDEIDGLRTFSRTCGEGAELVLVHGAGVSSRYWLPAQRILAGRWGFRAHALDFPGFGKSENPPWRPQLHRLTTHLEGWMEQVVQKPVHMIGQSIGCEIAVAFAAQRPDLIRSLVLAAPAGLPHLHSVSGQLLRALCDAPRERLGLYPAIIPDYFRCGPIRFWDLLMEQKRTQVEQLLPHVSVPTLVLRGASDVVVSSKRLAAVAHLLPAAQLVTIGGAHGAHFTHAEEFAAAVAAFLRQVDTAGPPGDRKDDSPGRLPREKGPIFAATTPPPGG